MMLYQFVPAILFFICSCNTSTMNQKTFSMICLGDSYTIGEKVLPEERFPNQCTALLNAAGKNFTEPKIIATTGWTTDELMGGITADGENRQFDFATLLIGVNNQYRDRSIDEYKTQFAELLNTTIAFAKANTKHVWVLSIPDWGVTPFAADRNRELIAKQIDDFNEANQLISLKAGVHYIDITPGSRLAATDASLVAEDGLHPSGKMYAQWAAQLSKEILQQLASENQ